MHCLKFLRRLCRQLDIGILQNGGVWKGGIMKEFCGFFVLGFFFNLLKISVGFKGWLSPAILS